MPYNDLSSGLKVFLLSTSSAYIFGFTICSEWVRDEKIIFHIWSNLNYLRCWVMLLDHGKGFEMHDIGKKDSGQSSVHSKSYRVNTPPSWWNSSASNYPTSYLKNSYMNMDSLAQQVNQLKHLGYQIADQDSSPTQSTGQSQKEMSGSSEGNIQEQCISVQSGTVIYSVIKLFHFSVFTRIRCILFLN